MAAGEYVSVSSQADTERADRALEREGLATNKEAEQEELAEIYVRRGLDAELAKKVARQLMDRDALAAHMRDELGITESLSARPLQAALASCASFTVGAMLPLLTAVVVPHDWLVPILGGVSLIFLTTLGAVAARIGGAPATPGAIRVLLWGAAAMALTAGVGSLCGSPV
jgi:VIT1/CCC1 family predicted Fe2+/Mn2+ transporter